jgi:hypothetical protein
MLAALPAAPSHVWVLPGWRYSSKKGGQAARPVSKRHTRLHTVVRLGRMPAAKGQLLREGPLSRWELTPS